MLPHIRAKFGWWETQWRVLDHSADAPNPKLTSCRISPFCPRHRKRKRKEELVRDVYYQN